MPRIKEPSMSDFCAWCGKNLPLTRREPQKYKKDTGVQVKTIEVAICEVCEEQARREKPPWRRAEGG